MEELGIILPDKVLFSLNTRTNEILIIALDLQMETLYV